MENVFWTCKSFHVESFHICCDCFDYCSYWFILFEVFLVNSLNVLVLFIFRPTRSKLCGKTMLLRRWDESKMCPLEVYYDADVHDALANLRKLDGDIPVHPQYGMSVIFLPPKNRTSSGPSPLLRNWGTSICTFALV